MKITIRKIQDAVRRLDKQQTNPTVHGGGTCVYTSETDPAHHCIAGEILYRLGVKLPSPGGDGGRDDNNAQYVSKLVNLGFFEGVEFTPGAVQLLQNLQSRADRATFSPVRRGNGEHEFGAVIAATPGARR